MLPLCFSALLLLAGCSGEQAELNQDDSAVVTEEEADNPILGGWYLVRGEYGEAVRAEGEPFQFKLFGEDQFAFLMKSDSGLWNFATTGSYELDGDIYRETFEYTTDTQMTGHTADWKYWLSGDTLYMEGPTRVVDAAGNAPPEFAEMLNSMREVRVRRQ